MPTVRALAANMALYCNSIVWMLLGLPLFFGPRAWLMAAMKGWALSSATLIRWIAGIRWEVRGLENLPRNADGAMGGFILAAKHQSAWETFALLPYLDDPVYILKKQLMHIPLFGWFAMKAQMIPVDRGAHAAALRKMATDARKALQQRRQIIIFPEGTRKHVGAEPEYKSGIVHLYKQLEVPLVPVALNSGLFWPRRKLSRYPGTLIVSILPPIEPGQKAGFVRDSLRECVERETNALVAEALATPNPPPTPALLKT